MDPDQHDIWDPNAYDVPDHFILESLQFLLVVFWQTMKPRSAAVI